MAVCVFFKRKNTTAYSLKSIIKYILDDEKTTEDLSFGFGVTPKIEPAFDEMMSVKKAFNKMDKRQYIHFAVSFKEGEISPELTKEISMRIAQYYAKDYQVLMAVHTDKPHLHCHFAINSVNINTGRKFKQSKGELRQFKKFCNEILAEYNVSLIEKMNEQAETTGEARTRMRGEIPWKEVVRTDIKNALKGTTSKAEFIRKMNSMGYKVKWTEERKNVTFTTPNGKPVRDYKLGFSKKYFENSFKQASTVQQSLLDNIRYICPSTPAIMDFPSGVIPPDLSGMSDDEIQITLSKFYKDLESQRCQVAAYNQEQQEDQRKSYQIDYLLDIIESALQELEADHSQENEEDDDIEL